MYKFILLVLSVSISSVALAGPIRDFSHKLRQIVDEQRAVPNNIDQYEVAEVSSRLFFRSDRKRYRSRYHKKRHYRSSRSAPRSIKAHGRKTFVFNPRTLTWGAYTANGRLVKSGRASGGRGYCPDVKRRCRTPVGHFSVYRKGAASCRSSKYPLGRGGAPMPHCMFFRGGYAIHGSPNVPNHNASHGCIRVPPSDARWLHRNFITHGTKVIVRPY